MSRSQTASAATTYTSIPVPISASDVISRSVQNLLEAISRHRPWPEFASSFHRPESFSSALTRIRHNIVHFRVNYTLLIGACGILSLIGSPGWLLVAATVVGMWLVIYFFREDPLVVWGHYLSDWAVLVGLVLVSFMAFWMSSGLGSVVLGLGAGLIICGLHGLFRDTESLFLNEDEAASTGLIGPTSPV